MNYSRNAIFHDGTQQFCQYDEEKDQYTFLLRTGLRMANQAYIIINNERIPMELNYSDQLFDYYSGKMTLIKENVYRYHFEIEGNETLFYNMSGAHTSISESYDFSITPGFTTPDWAKGAVMYQIYVERFCNGDASNDVLSDEYAYIGKGVTQMEDWDELPAADGTRQFYGGDLQGVLDKLDYLEKLGIQVIYFNPLFVSPSNHKYDIQDYDYIDPHFGKIVNDGGELLQSGNVDNAFASRYIRRVTDIQNLEASNQLFIKLVEEAHKRGIKVIIDGVFNHCGSFNKWMDHEQIYKAENGYEKGAYLSEDSPYHTFFKFHGGQWPQNNTYEGWWGFDTLPKLNYEDSEKLQQYILDIAKKWVSPPFNVDGWRLDVAADLGHSQEFNHEFWRKFRKAVKSANKDAIILAEHYGEAGAWLQGDQWDTVMNYDAFMDPVTWFLTGVDKHSDNVKPQMRGNAYNFIEAMNYHMAQFQNQSLLVAMNELSNHDHSRFMTRTNGMAGRVATAGSKAASENIRKAIFKQGVVMQMTLPGAPTLYYGDEAGVCGWTDPDNRRTYPWGKEDFEIMEFYRDMIQIHKQHQELKTGSYKALSWGDNFLAYGRFDEQNATVVAINTSENEIEMQIPVWQLNVTEEMQLERIMETDEKFYNAGCIPVAIEDGELTVRLKPESSQIFRTK